ncbi:MAG: site-specific integrase [Planctomycetota bacterium]
MSSPKSRKKKRKHSPVFREIEGVKVRLAKGPGQAYILRDGKRHYLGAFFDVDGKTFSPETEERARRWILEGRAGGGSAPHSISVAELIDRYLDYVEVRYVKHGEPSSEQECIRYSLQPLNEIYGTLRAAKFEPMSLEAIQRHHIGRGRARSTINARVNRIKRMFRWADGRGLIPPGISYRLSNVEALKPGSLARETKPITSVPKTDVAAVLPYLSKPVAAMVQIQLLTGMRPGEVVIMRATDIDESGPEGTWVYSPERHKTEHRGHERKVYLGKRAQQLLAPFLLGRQPEVYLFTPAEGVRQGPKTIHARASLSLAASERRYGDHYHVPTFRRAIKRACQRAEIPVWSPNRLRHSAATEAAKRFGREAAKQLLGQRSARIIDVYLDDDPAAAIRIARAVG